MIKAKGGTGRGVIAEWILALLAGLYYEYGPCIVKPPFTKEINDKLSEALSAARSEAEDGKPSPENMTSAKCQYCHLEYSVDIVSCGSHGVAAVFTAWYNLGSGRTVDDSKWRAWTRMELPPWRRNKRQLVEQLSIKEDFESQSGQTVQELTDRNVKLLTTQLSVLCKVSWKVRLLRNF